MPYVLPGLPAIQQDVSRSLCSHPDSHPHIQLHRALRVHLRHPLVTFPTVRRQVRACSDKDSDQAHRCASYVGCALLLLHLATASPSSAKAGKIESNPFSNIPDALAAPVDKVRELGHFLTGSNGPEVERCTRTCLPACLRGGQGAPGLGPLSMRREIIVFKDGYRTRKYCLSECTQVCALISNEQHAEMKGQK